MSTDSQKNPRALARGVVNKDQFETLLRSTGCDENSIRFGVNAFEMGMEHEREECAKICEDLELPFVADAIHARKNK